MFGRGLDWAWSVVGRFGVTPEKVEKTKMEFLAWLAERNMDVPQDPHGFLETFRAFREDTAGAMSVTDWILGIIIAAILGVGVALPIVIETVQTALQNASGITATVIGVIPVAVAISLLLVFLGR